MMNKENFKYLIDKVTRYQQLEIMKEKLNELQTKLVKDEDLSISVGDFVYEDYAQISDTDTTNKGCCSHVKDEHEELMREIKDNLIDSIGMKIVEINEKMEEL